MEDKLQRIMERPKRYDNIDGTGELFMGLMILGFALLGYLQAHLPEHSIWRGGLAGLLFMYAVLFPVLGLGFVIQKLVKRRITFPRTGYVAYRRDRKVVLPGMAAIFIISAGIAAVLGATFAVLAVLSKNHHGAITLGRGIYLSIWAPLYAFWVWRMGGGYPWKWLLLLFMVVGLLVLAFIVPGNMTELSRPVLLLVGFVWIISGAATLVSYLRHTPPPAEDAA